MAGLDDLDDMLEQFKQAGQELVKGNPEPVQELFSHLEDVTLANPPSALPRVDGSRSLRPRSVGHPCSEMARSTTSRP